MFTFWQSTRLKERVAFFLIMVQSVIDFGVGIVAGSIFTFFLASEIRGRASCWLYYSINRIIFMSTILSVSLSSVMCVERYMAVVHPVVHRNKVTRKLLSNYIACIYVLCVIMFGVSFVNKQAFSNFASIVVGLYVIMIAYSQINIFLAAIKSRKNTSSVEITPSGNTSSNKQQQRQFLAELKLAKSCFLAVVCCVLCFAPAVIVGRFFKLSYFNQTVFKHWRATLVFLNSSLNSVIFFWKNRVLRFEAKLVLRSIRN